MPRQDDLYNPNVSIGTEARRIRERFRKLKQLERKLDAREKVKLATSGGPAPPAIAAFSSPEHYHIVYQYEDQVVPHFAIRYAGQREAYEEVRRLGIESEPQTEWYDDGRVMIETSLHGRSGLFRVILRVTACIATQCGKPGSPLILPWKARA